MFLYSLYSIIFALFFLTFPSFLFFIFVSFIGSRLEDFLEPSVYVSSQDGEIGDFGREIDIGEIGKKGKKSDNGDIGEKIIGEGKRKGEEKGEKVDGKEKGEKVKENGKEGDGREKRDEGSSRVAGGLVGCETVEVPPRAVGDGHGVGRGSSIITPSTQHKSQLYCITVDKKGEKGDKGREEVGKNVEEEKREMKKGESLVAANAIDSPQSTNTAINFESDDEEEEVNHIFYLIYFLFFFFP